MNYYIYKLLDPETLQIRYVGYTSKPLETRLIEHIKDSRRSKIQSHKKNWIKKLLDLGKTPTIELLETLDYNIDNAHKIEQVWITFFKKLGHNLVNSTDGGAGIQGFKHSEKTKKLLAQKSKEAWIRMPSEEKERLKEVYRKKMLGNQYSKGRKDTETLKANKGKRITGKLNPRWRGYVLQKDLSGEVLNKYETLREAGDALGIDKRRIHQAIKGNKALVGYIWQYE